MTPWRIGRGWSDEVLQAELVALDTRPVSYGVALTEPAPAPGWTVERFQRVLGYEPPGPPLPDGLFTRARQGVAGYRFADPRITRGHFDVQSPLLGRSILVDIRALFVRLLAGLRIGDVVDQSDASESRFSIRMDTLAGHILDGSEWVQIVKHHQSGAVELRIAVQWRVGQLPAWWMAIGLQLFGRRYQERWRGMATRRLQWLGLFGDAAQAGSAGR